MKLSQSFKNSSMETKIGDDDVVYLHMHKFREFIEAIDKIEQALIAYESETMGIEEELIKNQNRIRSLEIDCLKIMAERDALAEIHKQVIREVLHASENKNPTAQNKQTQGDGKAVHKS